MASCKCCSGAACVFCLNKIPKALTWTFASDGTGDAACWNGQIVVLTYCTIDNNGGPPCSDCGDFSTSPSHLIWEGAGSAPCPIAQRPLSVICDSTGIAAGNGCRGTEFVGTVTFTNCNAGAFLVQGHLTSNNDASTVSFSVAAS